MNPVLLSAVTSVLMALSVGLATKLGIDSSTWAVIIGAIASLLVAVGLGVWKAALNSQNAVIKAAANAIAPTGGQIVTTPEIANGALKDVPNVVSK